MTAFTATTPAGKTITANGRGAERFMAVVTWINSSTGETAEMCSTHATEKAAVNSENHKRIRSNGHTVTDFTVIPMQQA